MQASTRLSNKVERTSLSSEFETLRSHLPSILDLLEKEKNWYGSLYCEQKRMKTTSVNLKQTQANEQLLQGVVLRLYDGQTLFEEATDQIELHALKEAAKRLVQRVEQQDLSRSNSIALPKTPYSPPSWKERLQQKLDPEILDQIPEGIQAHTPVHFGLRYQEDPTQETPEKVILKLQTLLQRCQQLAPQAGWTHLKELSFMVARQSFAREESLFIDRETNLSQTLYRVSLTLILMSGAERTYMRVGGLGGLEALAYSESDLLSLLKDLKALQTAERLLPGNHRVIFGPAVTGVLAHEAFGHSQEGDTCARGRSKAWELHHTGQSVGNKQATILNNPALYENGGHPYAAWGSYFFDEEGWLAQEQVLLNEGKLMPPMTNLTSAIRLGVPRSANGKRENWSHGVYTRQTNTYFSAGQKTLAEMMEELQEGYLALHPAGGMEDPKGMGIQVGLAYLYEVKEGKLTGRLFKGPAGGDIQMTGYTPDVLNAILSKSKIEFETSTPDRAHHPYQDVGGCGKYHKEFVYAGCGGPHLLLDPVMLG